MTRHRLEVVADHLADQFLEDGLPTTEEVYRLQLRAVAFAGAAVRIAETRKPVGEPR